CGSIRNRVPAAFRRSARARQSFILRITPKWGTGTAPPSTGLGAAAASGGAGWGAVWGAEKSERNQASAERPPRAARRTPAEARASPRSRTGKARWKRGRSLMGMAHSPPRGACERRGLRRRLLLKVRPSVRQRDRSPMNALAIDRDAWTAAGEALLADAIALR